MRKCKKHITFIFSILFILSASSTVFASGIVGGRAGYIPPSPGVPFDGFKTWVDTSTWKWTPPVPGWPAIEYRPEQEAIPPKADGTGGRPYRPERPAREKFDGYPGYWTLVPSGHYAKVHGFMKTIVDENYVFTSIHKKEDGSSAGLHYKIYLEEANIDTEGRVSETTIINPSVYFSVNRYQGKGRYAASNTISNVSVSGNTANLSGKFEAKYAGDSYSSFGVSFTATCWVEKSIGTSTEGVNEIVRELLSIELGESYMMPVNGFNAVNYTGSPTRKTDLIFLRSDSLEAGVEMPYIF